MKKRTMLGMFAAAIAPWPALAKEKEVISMGEKVADFAKKYGTSFYKEQIWSINQAWNNKSVVGYRACGATWLCAWMALYCHSLGDKVTLIVMREREKEFLLNSFKKWNGLDLSIIDIITPQTKDRICGQRPNTIISNMWGNNKYYNIKDIITPLICVRGTRLIDFTSNDQYFYSVVNHNNVENRYAPSKIFECCIHHLDHLESNAKFNGTYVKYPRCV